MWVRKNKTRLWEKMFTIEKPMANNVDWRDWQFIELKDGYIHLADETSIIEGIAINDWHSWPDNENPELKKKDMCIYQPKRDWEHFTMEVDNGEITQRDVGKTFWIIGTLQHINYATKADLWGQFRLEEVLSPTLWSFSYNFQTAPAPQWPKGNSAVPPTIRIGTVSKLPAGANPTVSNSGTANDIVLDFAIPVGANWSDGGQGRDWEKWETGDTIDIIMGKVVEWTQAAASLDPLGNVRKLNLTIPKGDKWDDGQSVAPRGQYIEGRKYKYLDVVRCPDKDWVGWSWMWKCQDQEAWPTDRPWEHPCWMPLNRDGEIWPKGNDWGTILVPVEGKPWKDWVGSPGRDGVDGKSPHDEWDFETGRYYSPLSMVRADTGKVDAYGRPIYGYYITQSGADGSSNPKDWSPRQLVVKDGEVWPFTDQICTVNLISSIRNISKPFSSGWVAEPYVIESFDSYTGNREMANSGYIQITKNWHYKIDGSLIVQNNSSWPKYINLGRAFIRLVSSRSNLPNWFELCTAKHGWPYSTTQWPRNTFNMSVSVDLYAGDRLYLGYRPQTDTNGADWSSAVFNIMGANDVSGQSSQGNILWVFGTTLSVNFLSPQMFQKDAPNKILNTI